MYQKLSWALALLSLTSSPLWASSGSLTAAPRDGAWWAERHSANVKTAQAGGIAVLFLGDSITDLWQGEGRPVWQKNFAPLAAANFGIGGDKVENVLWRVQNGEADGISPKVLVLLIGTNNLADNSVEDILATETELVGELRHRLPQTRILLLGVFPRVDEGSEGLSQSIAPLNAGLQSLQNGDSVFFLNFGELFRSPDGSISRQIMHDGLHLTEKGYQIWTDAMLPTLQKLLGPRP